VDRKIAWCGSLNILSHSRSSEVMIRFSQSDFVVRLMELSGTAYLLQQEERNDARKRRLVQLATALKKRMAFPPCSRCGGATELGSSKYEPFFGCASYHGGNCDGLVLELAVQDLGLTCPRCGGNIVPSASGHITSNRRLMMEVQQAIKDQLKAQGYTNTFGESIMDHLIIMNRCGRPFSSMAGSSIFPGLC
jgi:hypothetical protein